jgi:hypothetical protein
MPAPRRAAFVISVVAGACVMLAGCSSSSSSGSISSGTPASGGVNVPAPVDTSPASAPPASSKLTGKFCTDFRSVGEHVKLPANATGSLSALQRHGVPDLNKVAAYFDGLAAEAPPQAGQELRVIAADYKALAASIASGNATSLSKAASQMENVTTNGSSGNAFRQLISYMVTKCLAA